jgi:hypothetical protein
LIHEELPNGRGPAGDRSNESGFNSLARLARRIGAQLGNHGSDLAGVEQVARGWAAEVGAHFLSEETETHGADGFGRERVGVVSIRAFGATQPAIAFGATQPAIAFGATQPAIAPGFRRLLAHANARAPWSANRGERVLPRLIKNGAPHIRLPHSPVGRRKGSVHVDLAREIPGAIDSQVHTNPITRVELEEHLLAHSKGIHHLMPAHASRAINESALRRSGRYALTHKVCGELSGDAMDGMTFGHSSGCRL